MTNEIFDYSPHLLELASLLKKTNEASLKKKYDEAEFLSEKMIVEAKLLNNWFKAQLDT